MFLAAERYDQQRSGLGSRFLGSVEFGIERIRDLPFASPLAHLSYRRHNLRVFPYALIFRVDGPDIVIVAVAHHSRQPLYWLNRKTET